jgi:hypothetical protein
MARWWKIPEYHSCVKIADNHFQIECSLRGYTVKGTVSFLCVFTLALRVITNRYVKICAYTGEGWSKKEAKRQAAYNVYMVVKNQD